MREQLSWVRVGLGEQRRRLIRAFRRLPTLAPTANRGPCPPESVSDVRGRALDPFPAIVNRLLEALVLISVGHLAKAARKRSSLNDPWTTTGTTVRPAALPRRARRAALFGRTGPGSSHG